MREPTETGTSWTIVKVTKLAQGVSHDEAIVIVESKDGHQWKDRICRKHGGRWFWEVNRELEYIHDHSIAEPMMQACDLCNTIYDCIRHGGMRSGLALCDACL